MGMMIISIYYYYLLHIYFIKKKISKTTTKIFFFLFLLHNKRNGRSTRCCWNSHLQHIRFLLPPPVSSVIESVIRQHIPHKQIVTAVAGCSILLYAIFYHTLPGVMICWQQKFVSYYSAHGICWCVSD